MCITHTTIIGDLIFKRNATFIYQNAHETLKRYKNYQVNSDVHEYFSNGIRTYTYISKVVRSKREINESEAIKYYNSLPQQIKHKDKRVGTTLITIIF